VITFLRQASNTILMRILLAVVMVAVALSLGVTNFFIRNAAKHPVAHVGSDYISANDFLQELENKKQSLKQYFGRPVTDQEALGLGLVNRTLSELITRELITQESERLGIVASDEQLSRHMNEDPNFKDAQGKFSTQRFSEFLSKSRLSERKYLDDLRKVISRGMLAGVVDGQIRNVPKVFAEPMFRYLNEERDIEVITVEIDAIPDLPKPEEATLKEFYEKHVQYFQAPETRSFNMLLFSFQEIAQTVSVTPEDLKAMYQQSDNTVPEKRSVRFIPFATREDAMKATEELRGGAPFNAVYSRYTGDYPENAPKAQELELKQIRPEVGSEVFSMKKVHDVSEPIFLGGQYLLFILADIKPERTLTFDEQKFTLLKKYKSDVAREKMYEYTQRAEKMLSSGVKLSEVSDTLTKEGVPGVVMVNWDKITQDGKSIDGKPATGLSAFDPKILSTAFDTPQYTYSDPQKLKTEDYAIVEVTDIKAAHQRSFAEASVQAEHYWQSEQKRQKAAQYVKAIKDGLEKSQDATQLAAANFGLVTVLHKITRSNPPKDAQLSGILTQSNAANTNEIVLDVGADRVHLARIIATYPVSPENFNVSAPAFTRQVMLPLLGRDLLSSYVAGLEAYFPVLRNEDYFTNYFGKEDLNNAPKPQAPDL
jgi:peptidyl-prolyl cis-trans isomerase D